MGEETEIKLTQRVEQAFGILDQRIDDLEEGRLQKEQKGLHFERLKEDERRKAKENARKDMNRNFEDTRVLCGDLLKLLGKEYVIAANSKILTPEEEQKAMEISEQLYWKIMVALKISRHLVSSKNPSLRGKEEDHDKDFSSETPLYILERKIAAHFLAGNICTSLGVRTDPNKKDLSARAEYEKVISEGQTVYMALLLSEDQTIRELRRKLRVAQNIAASYLKLYHLLGDEEMKEKARRWYEKFLLKDYRQFKRQTKRPAGLFKTGFGLRGYIEDISELGNIECAFKESKYSQPICTRQVSQSCPYEEKIKRKTFCRYPMRSHKAN